MAVETLLLWLWFGGSFITGEEHVRITLAIMYCLSKEIHVLNVHCRMHKI